ncbi:Putative alcohol dehydrogenase, zinc-type, GroES-like superfamily, NAD(P)-binding domain superfamily [Colletotrichum destructivum]|uniref:Alcohol dehydrogenase, zinc-type, GroES-like superfamily, NAD(P)-binding domain superfamily n=1 Tax=Colletotrichum destructivum TaxID=34406 RepID=A0AAX4I777_9PEZI|nr:Putative alcohol dehydrogenase, zinc-type, GroES-like superfamily, NAD(P)-binding domain superfamily [Colletotrichum destructivum]
MSLPSTYKAWQVVKACEPIVPKDLPLRQPGPGQILVKVLACGVCHSDASMANGEYGPVHERVPGHEVVGDVVAVGQGVTRFKGGERVGGPWHGGHDGTCRSCQRGLFQYCESQSINGLSQDCGYAEYILLRDEAAVRVPSNLDPAQVAPLLCAGVTVFNGIRKMNIEHGAVVAVKGIGGLGYLAVQYASRISYKTVVLSSGSSSEHFAQELGSHAFINTAVENPVEKLKAMGGAGLIVATAPNPKAIGPLTAALAPGGKLLILPAVGNIEFNSVDLILAGASVHGWASGHALDSEDAIEFAGAHGVRALIEKFPMERAPEALEHMLSGKVRSRAVLTM